MVRWSRMPDRHKIKPMSLRLPGALSVWLAQRSADSGKPVRRVILEILEEARQASQ